MSENTLQFEKFPKIGRMKRECTVTEKIDGTNAQIQFDDLGNMMVGSRTREIWPEGTEGKPKGCDNYGFAQWAYDNQAILYGFLGEGCHFGEWTGWKIQRGYGLTDKKFFLFNTSRFGVGRQVIPEHLTTVGLDVVPILYQGMFDTKEIYSVMDSLAHHGSQINGFDNPEGIVVYHHALRDYFKITFEHDRGGKGVALQAPS